MVHTAAFGDTVDVEDEIYVPLFRCCDSAESVFDLLTAVLATVRFDVDKLGRAARGGFGASTELAERLAADAGLPFRQAHAAVARIVRDLSAAGADLRALTPEQVAAAIEQVSGANVSVTAEQIRGATDAAEFVVRRAVPGGPAPAATRAALARETERTDDLRRWLAERREALTTAATVLERRVVELRETRDDACGA
jgi:argininosuccinate lyase